MATSNLQHQQQQQQQPATNLLFPALPPELRNHIYSETISPSVPATTHSIPFGTKTWKTRHTTLYLVPTHRGIPGLLALDQDNYLEAREYRTWILSNAVEFEVFVKFQWHPETFVQKHWDEQVKRHFAKLAKRYAWVANVETWRIGVFWEPPLWDKQDLAGKIANGIVNGVLEFVKEKNGGLTKVDVEASLHIESSRATIRLLGDAKFGLGKFMDGRVGSRMEAKEVFMDRDVIEISEKEDRIPGTIFLPVHGNANSDDDNWLRAVREKEKVLVVRTIVDGAEERTENEKADVVGALSNGLRRALRILAKELK